MQTNPESAAVEAVAWPERMVNLPCPDGSSDRIVGFRIPEGHPALGKHGLSEPIAWLKQVTIEQASALDALRGEVTRLHSLIAEGCRRLIDESMRANAAERRVAELEAVLRKVEHLWDACSLDGEPVNDLHDEIKTLTKESP